jgi:ABC-type branched-subunit amino acid transport system substrate-binding protein
VFIMCLWTQSLLAQVLDRQDSGSDNTTQNILTNRDIISDKIKQTIKVAVVLPLSGNTRATGIRLLKSVPIIENLIENFKYDNQFGSKFTLKIILKNDGCDAETAKKIAHEIVTAGDIRFVIGHYCSEASSVAAAIYEKAGIIQITPFSTDPSLTEKGYKTFFRLAGRNDRYAEIAVDWLHEFRRRYKLATVYGDGVYGKAFVKNVVTGLELRARKEEKTNRTQDDYYQKSINLQEYQEDISALVDTLIDADVKLVYYGGRYPALVPLIKEAKRRKTGIIFFAGDSVQNYDFWVQSEGAAEDVIFTLTKDITRDVTQAELNQVKRNTEFNTAKKDLGLEEATRIYGIESRISIFSRNSTYKDRARFIREYFKKLDEFPDLYMSHIYASFQIIKDIVLSPELSNVFINQDGNNPNNVNPEQMLLDGYEIANYMKDKGSNTADENVGFSTIIGTVNFSTAGDWDNAEYVIYHWVNTPQDRSWLTISATKKIIGARGDFTRLF